MSWIRIIGYDQAKGKLKKLYDRVKGPENNVDNVLLIHSLRPHTLSAHMVMYKNVLHNSNNTLPKWYLEALGVYVSHLNHCSYCFEHHFAGFSRIYPDQHEVEAFKIAVMEDRLATFFNDKLYEGCKYAFTLTRQLEDVSEKYIQSLRDVGFTDGEILEINQVVSYFNYVNRSVVGLGVNTDGDILGLSPNDSDDPDNWGHS